MVFSAAPESSFSNLSQTPQYDSDASRCEVRRNLMLELRKNTPALPEGTNESHPITIGDVPLTV
jgi:hypothetical protein